MLKRTTMQRNLGNNVGYSEQSYVAEDVKTSCTTTIHNKRLPVQIFGW